MTFSERQKCKDRENFPGNPAVKTLCFHSKGLRIQSLVRELRSHMPIRQETIHTYIYTYIYLYLYIHIYVCTRICGSSQRALVVKNLPTNAENIRDVGSLPESGRSVGRGHGNPVQYSCLENPHGQRSLAGYTP